MSLCLCSALFPVACGRGTPVAQHGSGAGYDSLSVYAEFTWLPEMETMRVSVYPESTVVVRRDSSDSVLSAVRKPNGDTARGRLDSARTGFGRLSPGEYRKEQVIDGTRIRVRHRGLEIFCDNCLHDFVLEAAGVAVPGHTGTERKLRHLVNQVSELAVLAEGTPKRKQQILELVVDRKAMRDTTRSYELGRLP